MAKAKKKAAKPAKKVRRRKPPRNRKKVVKLAAKKNGNGHAEALDQAVRPGRQGARRRAHPRLHARAVGPDLHAAARLHGRGRHQGGAPRRRRHHARPIARRAERGLALLHDAQRQQALDHDRHQAPEGPRDPRPPDQAVRRAGGELRARRARPHGADLGAHPQAQPAHDRRLGEGLRPRPVRGLQGLRERRAMRRRLGLDHRLPRGPAARHRRADRRLRDRPASRARHRVGALSAHPHRPRPEGAVRHAGRRAQPRAREAARPAAPRARPAEGIQPVRRGRAVRQGGAARRQRLAAAASPAGSSSARAGRTIPTPTSISSRRRRCGARSAT